MEDKASHNRYVVPFALIYCIIYLNIDDSHYTLLNLVSLPENLLPVVDQGSHLQVLKIGIDLGFHTKTLNLASA